MRKRTLLCLALVASLALNLNAQRPAMVDQTGKLIDHGATTLKTSAGVPLATLATDTALTEGLAGKVSLEAGKGLSSNDYTDTDKATLTAATSANTASAIVRRDASGNFSAGTITAALTGSATQLGGVAAASYAQKLTANTTVNIGTAGKSTRYLSGSAVDAGGGMVDLPCTAHGFAAGDPIKIYDGPAPAFDNDNYTVDTGSSTDTIRIEAAYVAADFGADSTSVYYRQSTTAAQAQALLTAVPRYLNKYALTAQFADGWYEFSSNIIAEFFNDYQVTLTGNSADNSLADRKRVVLNFSGSGGILAQINKASIIVSNLKVIINTGASSAYAVYYMSNGNGNSVLNCSLHMLSTGMCIYATYTNGLYCVNNFFRGGTYGIRARFLSHVQNGESATHATQPAYGLTADASVIRKTTGATQPTGSTAATNELNGGEIK